MAISENIFELNLYKIHKAAALKRPFYPFAPLVLALPLHKDDVPAYFADAVHREDIVILPAKQPEKLAGSRNNKGEDIAAESVHLHIADKAQAVP